MYLKGLILALMLFSLYNCQSGNKHHYKSFDEYPTIQGRWEEMEYSPDHTLFSLWAPTAQEVRVMMYDKGEGGAAYRMLSMVRQTDGRWTAKAEGDMKGKFYTFNVKINDLWLGDTPGVMAKAVGVNGKRAAIIDMRSTDPDGWDTDRRPPLKSFSDIIIYEMHHRDFSIDTAAGFKYPGKFLALTEEGTHTLTGDKTGLDHLRELGITHVHLLPSFDFATIDETKTSVPQYDWGYSPQNYNVPEGSYSTDPYKPETRIIEFKKMVQALHANGIRVILDVVYNHTATLRESNFERTVPGYFYRTLKDGSPANATGCGNETASERTMMRKFMIESVCYWAKEYHIDGFRFDLMGVHDVKTMNKIRKALDEIDPTIFIYGEGWAAGKPQLPQPAQAIKNNISHMPGISAFSDEFRDSLRGPFGNDASGAFIAGVPNHEAGVAFGLAGGISHPQIIKKVPHVWAQSPQQFISYVSCHDDLCLTDRLKKTLPGASSQDMASLQKLAETAILTSQGIPFIFAGDEMMRSKHGIANSYNSPDSINMISWAGKSMHRDVFDYVKGLIAMRKGHPAFRLGDTEQICRTLRFITVPKDNVVAFLLKGRPLNDSWLNTIVVLNARTEPVTVDIPEGKYWIVCKDGKIDLILGLGTITGSQLTVSPRSAMIVHQ